MGSTTGDVQSAFAAYASGPITIVDEFAPHLWTGPNAAHDWADAYDKHAQATGVSDGKVTYGKPTRVEQVADAAYVVMPTVYLYKEHGKPMKEEGQITAVLNRESGAWKIRGWTWTRRQAASGAVANGGALRFFARHRTCEQKNRAAEHQSVSHVVETVAKTGAVDDCDRQVDDQFD